MSVCEALHKWANSLHAFHFPFDENKIPMNGIYILFEKGEAAHGTKRIVRVGSHTGDKQLRSRLRQHFVDENKDRSIFRKNIGRAPLNRDHDDFLRWWELDLTSRKLRDRHAAIDSNRQRAIEGIVSKYIRAQFSFVVVHVDEKLERLRFESRASSSAFFTLSGNAFIKFCVELSRPTSTPTTAAEAGVKTRPAITKDTTTLINIVGIVYFPP
jgi:hypothetical protein